MLGAKVYCLSNGIPNKLSHFEVADLRNEVTYFEKDILSLRDVAHVIDEIRPDFIFHLAAQALVRQSYNYPAKLPSFLAMLGLFEMKHWKAEREKRQDLLASFLELSYIVGLTEFLPPLYLDNKLKIVPLRFVYTHPLASIIKKNV